MNTFYKVWNYSIYQSRYPQFDCLLEQFTMYTTDFQDVDTKRVKERLVESAYLKVQMWRRIFLEGLINEQGEKQYYTLNEAANFVGIPKKTLEDYTQIFHKVGLVASIFEFQGKKMGFLRSYIRKNKSKIRKALYVERIRQYERKQEKLNKKCDENSPNLITQQIETESKCEQIFYEQSNQEEIGDFQESQIVFPFFKF